MDKAIKLLINKSNIVTEIYAKLLRKLFNSENAKNCDNWRFKKNSQILEYIIK